MAISNLSSGARPGVCTSTTRPTTPFEGQMIYETDTDKLLIYNGSAWNPPWNTAWGFIGSATKSSNQGSITTGSDVTGLSITFTAVANRKYKISTQGMMLSSSANDIFNWIINAGGSDIMLKSFIIPSTSFGVFTGCETVHTPSAGSITYKVRAARNSGSSTGTVVAGSGYEAILIVEDIGPA